MKSSITDINNTSTFIYKDHPGTSNSGHCWEMVVIRDHLYNLGLDRSQVWMYNLHWGWTLNSVGRRYCNTVAYKTKNYNLNLGKRKIIFRNALANLVWNFCIQNFHLFEVRTFTQIMMVLYWRWRRIIEAVQVISKPLSKDQRVQIKLYSRNSVQINKDTFLLLNFISKTFYSTLSSILAKWNQITFSSYYVKNKCRKIPSY